MSAPDIVASAAGTAELRKLAAGTLAPGFNGTSVPGWLRRAGADGLGGVVLFGHNIGPDPARVRALCDELHGLNAGALLVHSDEEGGDVTRVQVHTGSSLPGAAALGRIGDPALTRRVAAAHGAHLRSLGIDVDLAPVADVNSDPGNPVIGIRSFSDDTGIAAEHVTAYVQGLQEAGVLACAKHFPGHGDTAVDSHLALPTLALSLQEIRDRELVPFRAAFAAGVAAVMPGHLTIPAVDAEPASLSAPWYRILRDELGFGGLTVTDALDMKAVADVHGVPGAAVLALQAGADVLCLGNTRAIDDEQMYHATLAAILDAVSTGSLPESRLVEARERREVAIRRLDELQGRCAATELDAALAALDVVGREAAERALDAVPRISGTPMILDLRAGINIAAGPIARHLVDTLQRTWPDAVVVQAVPAVPVDGLLLVLAGRQTDRAALERAVATSPDAVIIWTGWPAAWHPIEQARVVFSYGNAVVTAAVLGERLSGG
ncbi:MAG: glycoside hydrolase family 3 N-terminal domain-containing protein [Nakamurella sp.]